MHCCNFILSFLKYFLSQMVECYARVRTFGDEQRQECCATTRSFFRWQKCYGYLSADLMLQHTSIGYFVVILNTLVSWFLCVWLAVDVKLQDGSPPGARLATPALCHDKKVKPWYTKNILPWHKHRVMLRTFPRDMNVMQLQEGHALTVLPRKEPQQELFSMAKALCHVNTSGKSW